MAPELKDFILKYPWPGNVRELRNSIERAILLFEGDVLMLNHFAHLYTHPPQSKQDEIIPPQFVKLKFEYEKVDLKQIDKLYALEILQKMNGNKTKTAKQLGISRPKLDILLKQKKN